MYRPESSNVDADILSRYPTNQDCTEIHNDSVKATCACIVTPSFHTIMSVDILEATEFPGQPMAQVDMREIRKEQLNDSLLGFWVRAVRDKNRPQRLSIHSREDSVMLKYFDNLKLIRGILHRETGIESEKKCQFVLPLAFIEQVLSGLHNDMGHPSKDRTLSLLHDRFWWPGMTSDTEAWVSNCGRCIRRKSKTDMRARL